MMNGFATYALQKERIATCLLSMEIGYPIPVILCSTKVRLQVQYLKCNEWNEETDWIAYNDYNFENQSKNEEERLLSPRNRASLIF